MARKYSQEEQQEALKLAIYRGSIQPWTKHVSSCILGLDDPREYAYRETETSSIF